MRILYRVDTGFRFELGGGGNSVTQSPAATANLACVAAGTLLLSI